MEFDGYIADAVVILGIASHDKLTYRVPNLPEISNIGFTAHLDSPCGTNSYQDRTTP